MEGGSGAAQRQREGEEGRKKAVAGRQPSPGMKFRVSARALLLFGATVVVCPPSRRGKRDRQPAAYVSPSLSSSESVVAFLPMAVMIGSLARRRRSMVAAVFLFRA
jgi:hypothetical protein